MNEKQREQLQAYAQAGDAIEDATGAERWALRVGNFLETSLGKEAANKFRSLQSANTYDTLALALGHLEGLLASSDATERDSLARSPVAATQGRKPDANSRKVFVVHGHDGESKEMVARFLEKLELEPIILHEQPNQGRTIIEKFEMSSRDVAFAVILLTPDDVGAAVGASADLRGRARQNVILELGYFMGRLGRTNVCALHKSGVELPSDYQGVLYVEFDPSGARRTKLAQEFVEAKVVINLQALLRS